MTQKTGYPSIDRPWLKYYSEEAINGELPQNTIYEYMLENNRDYPNDVAIRYFSRKITYRELFERIDDCARALVALGVKPGEIVTVALPSIPEALYIVYALNKIGAVANMIHPLAGQREILNYLNEVESRVAILFDGTYDIIRDAIQDTNVTHAVVVTVAESLPFGVKQLYSLKQGKPKLGGVPFMAWGDFIKKGWNVTIPDVKKDPDTMAIISHTGGTTGEPKGVMCSDRSINAIVWQIVVTFPHNRQEKKLVVLPPFINYSLINSVIEPLAMGHVDILLPKYDPKEFVHYIKKYCPNHIDSIPPYMEAVLSIKGAENADYSCLKYVFYGGEAMNGEVEEKVNELLCTHGAQFPIGKGLGSTEMISCATLTMPQINTYGSVGVPLPRINCMICDTLTMKEESYNQIGEICFSGPTLMLGYYNNQAATDEIIKTHPDGRRWLHTGDLGYINEDGVVFVTGRIKRIIMTKGADGNASKLFPDRIEKAIYSHPAVELCCIVGVPDEKRINIPKAYVVLKEGIVADCEIRKSILAACREALPDYMVPENIEFRADLPRTERGKIDYRALEALARK